MKKALIFRGGWDGHNPIETSDIIAGKLRAAGVDVDVHDTKDCLLDPELKAKYNLIVPVWTMGTIEEPEAKALLDAIKSGVSCSGWHVDPGNRVLATTTFNGDHAAWIAGTVMPVIWTRRFGAGKVFYSSLGHNLADFQNTPQVTEIIIRGLLWSLDML